MSPYPTRVALTSAARPSLQGFLYEGMIEVINQFYSMNLATEVLKGLRENASRGWSNGGKAPYGYRKKRVTDPTGAEHVTLELGPEEEVALVREIFDLATQHGQGGKTIAATLNARGVKGPSGRLWRASSVNNILGNATYCGDLVWFKTKRKKGRKGRTSTDPNEQIVVRDAIPAIVSREVFESRAAASKTRTFRVHTTPAKHVNYLLGRLITCQHCGASFVGRRREYTNHKGERVTATAYYCAGYLFKGREVCRSLPIDQAWIEGTVLDTIRARLVDPAGWDEIRRALVAKIEDRRRRYFSDPKAVAQKVADLDRKIMNYYRAIGEGMDPGVCKPLIAELTAKKEAIEREAETLRTENYYTTALEKNLQALERLRHAFGDRFHDLPFTLQRQAILLVVDRLVVRNHRDVQIHLHVPMNNVGIKALADETDAVGKGTWKPKEGDLDPDGREARTGEVTYDQSGPGWWAIQDSNL